ncbi:MAG TPA: DciA family protein [Alphaproteobacteria bacterium]|jgi:hypothetical protein|nr:DciA family protein [Alphaproteobacteria bacterium]
MQERRQGLRAIGVALPSLTRRALGRRGFAEGGLALDWAAIVGEDVAVNTLPLRVAYPRGGKAGGTLYLKVASGYGPIIAHCEPQLIERVNAYLGYGAIARLKMTQGGLSRPSARSNATGDSEPAESVPGIDDKELAYALGSFARALRGRR